jgi:hypothetical protein
VATVVRTWFDKEQIGRGGDVGFVRAGKLYYGLVANNAADQGDLYVGAVGEPLPRPIALGPLGLLGALQVDLDANPDTGFIHAHVSRLLPDSSGEDRGRRAITEVQTDLRFTAQDGPVTPPAPPGATVDLSAVLQAIDAARGPLDGSDAEFNTVAGVKNTAEATYKKVVDETSAVLGVLDPLSQLAREAARAPGWLWQPPTRDYGLPHELEPFVGTDFQQYLCATVIALLEFVTRLSEFPKLDGTSILRT